MLTNNIKYSKKMQTYDGEKIINKRKKWKRKD